MFWYIKIYDYKCQWKNTYSWSHIPKAILYGKHAAKKHVSINLDRVDECTVLYRYAANNIHMYNLYTKHVYQLNYDFSCEKLSRITCTAHNYCIIHDCQVHANVYIYKCTKLVLARKKHDAHARQWTSMEPIMKS